MYPSENSGCLRLDGSIMMGVSPRPRHSKEFLCFVNSLASLLEGQTPIECCLLWRKNKGMRTREARADRNWKQACLQTETEGLANRAEELERRGRKPHV